MTDLNMHTGIETFDLTKTFTRSSPRRSRFNILGKKAIPRTIAAVDRLNLTIKRGELFGLLGPNGAGKTTTVRMLSTLLIPTSGTATVDGNDILLQPRKVQAAIGVVLGGERSLYWRLTGRENLWLFSQLYGLPKQDARSKIAYLLELVGLEEWADERVEKYSRGMKQKLHIARSLVNDPTVLILDEPTSGLDPASARSLRDFIKNEIQGKQSKTVLLTTHNMQEADQLCNRVAIMDDGRILADGRPDDLKRTLSDVEVVQLEVENFLVTEKQLSEGLEAKIFVEPQSTPTHVKISVHTKLADSVVPVMIERLVRSGARVLSFTRVGPSLEDVFLSITGKRFSPT